MKKDPLYLFIVKHLEETPERSESFEELIVEAVADYLAELMEISFIPHIQLDGVEEILMEDAWDILRKVSYGSLTLQDYRDSRQKHERRKKMSC